MFQSHRTIPIDSGGYQTIQAKYSCLYENILTIDLTMRKHQYLDLQASMPSDPHCRRHAFLLIALLYALAGADNI
ncbi:hypothetical protein D0T23_27850 [Duganella sp. BJB475]|nr:hypothetical protein D0T23_27850 [Duganella sp. BJB475]